MARSKKTTDALMEQLLWLIQQHAEITEHTSAAWKQIQKWPVRTVVAHGQKYKGSVVMNEQLSRTHDDLMREKGRIGYEISRVVETLFPSNGRPKGKRNEKAKPPDPTIMAALKDLESAPGPKPKARVLAVRHCKDRTEQGRKMWIHRLKKAITKANRSQS